MSERITHTAVVDDCFRLATADPSLHPAIRTAMTTHHDLARLASATRHGDRHNVGLLEGIRDRLASDAEDADAVRHLAFVLGWVCHRAADRQMKPVFRAMHPVKKDRPTECSVYHDAFILRTVYGIDGDPMYPSASLGLAGPQDPELAERMRLTIHALLQQSLIEMHTLIPDDDDAGPWVDKVCSRMQSFYVDIDRYAKAIAEPDAEKMQRFIIDDGFYAEGDRLISLARELQKGTHTGDMDSRAELAQPAESHYGKSLKLGLGYMLASDDFLHGRIDSTQLHDAFDIGVLGRDGIGV